jgi:multidrug efflux system membrane fusion protein
VGHDIVRDGAERRTGRPPRTWPWVLLLLVVAAAGIAYWVYARGQASAAAEKSGAAEHASKRAVPVVAAVARRGNLSLYLNGLGTVTPLNTVAVRTRVDGELVKVHFVEGQAVKEGDLLAEIDPRPFEVQLQQAQGQLARDQAILTNARADLERYRSAGTAVSRQQIDQQAALVQQYEGALLSDRGQIESAKLNLTYCRITSPLTGRIGLRRVDVGNRVHANDARGIAVVTQIQPIAVLFTIPQDRIAQVMRKPRHGVGLPVQAWNRDLTRKIADGTLVAVDNQVDPASGTVRLKASFPNEDNSLFPNEFVNARLLIDTIEGATLVPAAAVQHGPQNWSFAYVVKPGDSTVEMRQLTLGPTEGDQTVVTDGVAPGETVVTDGVDKLQDGSKVDARIAAGPGGSGAHGAVTTHPAAHDDGARRHATP